MYWHPHKTYWIKCNTDSVVLGSPKVVACFGIFCDSSTPTLDCFAKNLGITYAFHAYIIGVMMTINISYSRG